MAWRPSEADRAQAEARIARVEAALGAAMGRVLDRAERQAADRLRSVQVRKGTYLWDPPGDAPLSGDAVLPLVRWDEDARPDVEILVRGLLEEYAAAAGIDLAAVKPVAADEDVPPDATVPDEAKADPFDELIPEGGGLNLTLHKPTVPPKQPPGTPLGIVPDFVDRWTGAVIDSLRGIRQGIVDAIDQAGKEKRDQDALQATLAKAFRDARSTVADEASRTAVGSANEAALWAAHYSGGPTHKFWLSSRDEKVRPTHRVADGQVRPLAEPFVVGGSLMQYPGARTAPIGEWINCRCSMLFATAPASKTLEGKGHYSPPRVRTAEGARRYHAPIGSPILWRVTRRQYGEAVDSDLIEAPSAVEAAAKWAEGRADRTPPPSARKRLRDEIAHDLVQVGPERHEMNLPGGADWDADLVVERHRPGEAYGAKAERHVRTAEGARRFKLPIGSPIAAFMAAASGPPPYQGLHHPPGPDYGGRLDDLTRSGILPEDMYDHPEHYRTGFDRADQESFRVVAAARGRPDAKVRIYRAAPAHVDAINPGDWVTLSKSYAEQHARSELGESGHIVSRSVPARDLWTNGDSINEWGWHPPDLYFHVSPAELPPGTVLKPGAGKAVNEYLPGSEWKGKQVWMTDDPFGAYDYALKLQVLHSTGGGKHDHGAPHIYAVRPDGDVDRDPRGGDRFAGSTTTGEATVVAEFPEEFSAARREHNLAMPPEGEPDQRWGLHNVLRSWLAGATAPAATGDGRTEETDARGKWRVITEQGTAGNNTHITRDEIGTLPTSVVAGMPGVMGEVPGAHRNMRGKQWDDFKADVAANGIKNPIFVTKRSGEVPQLSEGNHRRDAAVALGLPEVPVQVRYYGHSEREGLVGDVAESGPPPKEVLDDPQTPDEVRKALDDLGAEPVEFPGGQRVWAFDDPDSGDRTVVEWDGDTYPTVTPMVEWVSDVNDPSDYYPEAEQQFNDEFWARPEPLYHGTQGDYADSIEANGLNPDSKTRGISNRWVGPSVYASTEPDDADSYAYGPDGGAIVTIDTQAMKRDGLTPFVSEEPDVLDARLREAILSRLGDPEPFWEGESDMSPNTVVIGEHVPAKYLHVDRRNGRGPGTPFDAWREAKVAHVRTEAGARKYKLPIGSPIVAGDFVHEPGQASPLEVRGLSGVRGDPRKAADEFVADVQAWSDRYPGVSNSGALRGVGGTYMTDDTVAVTTDWRAPKDEVPPDQPPGFITLNLADFTDRASSELDFAQDRDEGYAVHSDGRKKIDYAATHEFAHAMFLSLPERSKDRVMNAVADCVYPGATSFLEESRGLPERIADNLSWYAATNPMELIAEAWTEYKLDPKPRPWAREIGSRLDREYTRRFGQRGAA